MKKRLSLVLTFVLALAVMVTATACGKKEEEKITLGSMSTTEPIVVKIKEHLNNEGYNAETVLFDANNAAAIAAKDGDLSGFVHNHKPWIDTFNKENNSKLTVVDPHLAYYRFAMYSSKYKNINEFSDNMTIGIANDPTNTENSLKFLENLGLLKLGEKKGEFYTILDIKENPKNIKFYETDVATIARSINDVDAVISPAIRIQQAGLDPNKFIEEDKTSKDFPVGLTVNEEDKDKDWVKEAQKYISTDEFRTWFENEYNGTLVQYKK